MPSNWPPVRQAHRMRPPHAAFSWTAVARPALKAFFLLTTLLVSRGNSGSFSSIKRDAPYRILRCIPLHTPARPSTSAVLRRAVPEESEVPELSVLRSPQGTRLVILGTAHVSARDALRVKQVIAEEQPEAVVVEIDPKRLSRLNLTLEELGPQVVVPEPLSFKSGDDFAPGDPRALAASMAAPLLRQAMTFMYSLLAAGGMQPGGELAAAITEGREVGARLVLADADATVTIEAFLRRAMRSNPFDLLRRYSAVVGEEFGSSWVTRITPDGVDELKSQVKGRLFDRLRDEVPEFYDTIIGSRDASIAAAITAEERRGSKSIVAVVGIGHVLGVVRSLAWQTEAVAAELVPE